MRPRLFLIPLALSSAACTPAEDYDDMVGVDASASAIAGDSARSEARGGGARSIAVENELYAFGYAYPAEAGRHAKLAAELDRRAQAAQAELEAMARGDRASAAEADYTYRQHSTTVEWSTVADLSRWLSLSARIATYSGGAHGNYGFDSLLWDKQAGGERAPLDLFRSPLNFYNAIAGRFCAMLDAERERRRGEPVDPASVDAFDDCPGVEELTVLLGSSNGETFDRVGILIGPYVAGPYAEGSYEFTLPVDTALLDAVKPEYREAFSLGIG